MAKKRKSRRIRYDRPKRRPRFASEEEAKEFRERQEARTRRAAELIQKIHQRGDMLKPPKLPPAEASGPDPANWYYVEVSGYKLREWVGFLRQLSMRYSSMHHAMVVDRIPREHADFVEELVVAWVGDRLHVSKGRGLYVEPERVRTSRWRDRLARSYEAGGRSGESGAIPGSPELRSDEGPGGVPGGAGLPPS